MKYTVACLSTNGDDNAPVAEDEDHEDDDEERDEVPDSVGDLGRPTAPQRTAAADSVHYDRRR